MRGRADLGAQDTLGDELDVLDEPVEFLLGGDDLLKRIEEALQGHQVGATLDLHLEPETRLATTSTNSSSWSRAPCSPPSWEGMTFEGRCWRR